MDFFTIVRIKGIIVLTLFSDYPLNREEVFFCENGLVLLKLCFKGLELKLRGWHGGWS